MPGFQGFHRDTFSFLAGLTMNNERSWFEAHRTEYDQFVVTPALALITELDDIVRAISPHYRGVAKKIGGSLMRVYRDTRFSRDKTPYKTNIGIQFRHEDAKDVHAPGWYVHLDLQECFVGAGAWHPEPADLLKIRQSLADRPELWSRAIAQAASRGLTAAGESLQKSPKGFDPDHAMAAEIRRKDFLLSATLPPELFFGRGLVTELESVFRVSAPYMAQLCQALGAKF
jgi:uncharacterized protein (TIGR02453 family)